MNVLNEPMTRSETSNDAKLIALGEERVAAWARFYAIAADSTPGELEYDRALAAAKNLDAAPETKPLLGGRQSPSREAASEPDRAVAARDLEVSGQGQPKHGVC